MRMLASVKPERFLEAGNPTGLTGLFTHPNPRSTLLYLYGTTLEKLKAIPEHSVYRQSTEALTKHRYNIVDSFKPPGYAEWTQRMEEKMDKLEEDRDQGQDQNEKSNRSIILGEKVGEYVFGSIELHEEKDERLIEWDGEEDNLRRSARSTGAVSQSSQQQDNSSNMEEMKWEAEPPLEALQYVVLPYWRARPSTTRRVGYQS